MILNEFVDQHQNITYLDCRRVGINLTFVVYNAICCCGFLAIVGHGQILNFAPLTFNFSAILTHNHWYL